MKTGQKQYAHPDLRSRGHTNPKTPKLRNLKQQLPDRCNRLAWLFARIT